jgi:hypothetical protein
MDKNVSSSPRVLVPVTVSLLSFAVVIISLSLHLQSAYWINKKVQCCILYFGTSWIWLTLWIAKGFNQSLYLYLCLSLYSTIHLSVWSKQH